MLNVLFRRVYNSLLAFSIMLLSNYTGNEPKFSNFFVEAFENGVYIRGLLLDAFENDFEEIFNSGILTSVIYDIEVVHGRSNILQKTFVNTAIWNFEIDRWIVHYGEENETIFVNSYEDLKRYISFIETFVFFDVEGIDIVDISISARLPVIHIPSIQKSIDLMVLWKMKAPQAKININMKVPR